MKNHFSDIFNTRQLTTLASIVQVGDAAYRDLMETQRPMFGHPYFADTRGRIRTKLVQMQCEIESHEPNFPFEFAQRNFEYNQCIPELRTKDVILHIARSTSPDVLPYESKYKLRLSNNNFGLQRQMVIDTDFQPPYAEVPFYGLLVFGGRENTFAAVQFPEPGYESIAEIINIPQMSIIGIPEETVVFERKKAVLKQEFLARGLEEAK